MGADGADRSKWLRGWTKTPKQAKKVGGDKLSHWGSLTWGEASPTGG